MIKQVISGVPIEDDEMNYYAFKFCMIISFYLQYRCNFEVHQYPKLVIINWSKKKLWQISRFSTTETRVKEFE